MKIVRPSPGLSRLGLLCAPMASALLLASCGGGGSDTPAGTPTVSSVTAGGLNGRAVMYSQSLLVTVNGSSLDGGLSVTSPGCKAGPVLSTTAPYVSSSTTAYYTCTVSSLGTDLAVNVARASDGSSLATAKYTVPVPQVTMTVKNGATVNGLMVFTLAPDKTPLTVDNFLAYVNSGFYDGTVFHRVVAGFVIQGGGYLPITPGVTPVEKTPVNAPIPLEVGRGLSNTQWTIAMARQAGPDTATSQFFINVVDNSSRLDPQGANAGYAVFGTLSSGTSVVSSILGAPCAPLGGFSECVPDPNVVITAALQSQ